MSDTNITLPQSAISYLLSRLLLSAGVSAYQFGPKSYLRRRLRCSKSAKNSQKSQIS